jgi:multidrug efflux system membrane fusion protein
VVKADSTAEIRPISPGQRQGDMLVVEQGIQPGENVVVAGHMAVRPNGKVLVTNGKSGSVPPAGTQPSAPKSATADASK